MNDMKNQPSIKSDPKKISDSVIERIRQEGINPLPEIYELFYIYYSGMDSEITRAIDIMVTQKFDLTEERCLELYHRYLNDHHTEMTLSKAEQIVAATLTGVDQMVDSFKNSNSDLDGTIEAINAGVAEAVKADDFKSLLVSILKETQKMVSENHTLEKRLEQSSKTMSELKHEMEMVRQEAYIDALTGIPNRKKFDLEIIRLVAEARDEGTPISMIFIDIDHFKSFNDTYGHQIGDQVLRLVARAFRESLKGQDFFCRFGGEEFVILLPKTPLEGAGKIADILRQSIRNKDIINKTTNEMLTPVTISSGVAQLKEDEILKDWVERADQSLYKAKQQGRNCVVSDEG